LPSLIAQTLGLDHFDHADLSIEESGENDEIGEDDKAGDAEVTGF
jgi:hypothetical protein